MESPGLKKLTPENWLQPEWVMTLFVRMRPEDLEPRPVSGEDWVSAIAKPTLDESVPEEVKGLFETVRGALAYGFFFYPLYGLGLGQLFRVAEAAVTHKCKAMGTPTAIKTFYDRTEWLVSHRVIPEQEKGTWDAIRKMRNLESHPERQILLPPGTAIGVLVRMAENINALYGMTAGTR